jgi:ribosomal protein S18 acetylase RimI-like enzyme
VSTAPTHAIVARPALTAEEAAQVNALRAEVNAADSLDLKLGVELLQPGEPAPAAPTQFLAYADHRLAGYCSLDAGGDIELCGMVHPDHRHRGIGRHLLDAALAESRRRGAARVLLIAEDASATGRAFVGAQGATLAFSEQRMEADVPAEPALAEHFPAADRLTIAVAGPADLDDIAAVQSAAFHDDPIEVRDFVREGLQDGRARYYVARLGGVPVGSLKVYTDGPRAGIYAFGVAPQYRRRGFGSQILRRVISQLAAEGHPHLWLEVEFDNAPALALYRSLGFRPTTTYGYYALTL